MDFQQQQQQQLLLAAALWPPQRAAAIATILRNNGADNNGTNNNDTHGTTEATANVADSSVLLAQLHQTPAPPPSTFVRQIIQSPIGTAGTIRLFDPAQGLPLGGTVPEALTVPPNHHQQHHHQQHQLVDQLVVAAAFQQMMERLRGGVPEPTTAKFVPPPITTAQQQKQQHHHHYFGDNNGTTMGLAQQQHQQQQQQVVPHNFGSLSNLSSSSSSSSSAPPSSSVPAQQIKTEFTKKMPSINVTAEDSESNQKPFVPTPTTTADELIGHALTRLMEQLDNDGTEALDDGHFQEGPSSSDGTSISRTNSSSNNNNEEVLLCKVCSDKASGFHYGIFSCEGCKGFFRRSLQNKIDYRPCTQSQKCQIVRASRNRCQECRWRKCIEAGMSKDSVRYGRVPKREKEKMREEMRRDSARSAMEQLSAELEDEKGMVDQLERAFAELGTEMSGRLEFFENSEPPGTDGGACRPPLLNARRYMQMVQWVCRFASRIRGFRLLRREERVRLIRDAHFPVLLLRLCTLRRRFVSSAAPDDKLSAGQMDKMPNNSLVGLAAVPNFLMVPSSMPQNGPLVERIVEFVHRLREAQPPVELCPTDRQLSLIAALCLCRAEGAGEHAAGALMSASVSSAATSAGADDGTGHAQLQLAIARRIHERLWQSLNATLATDLLPFGPSLLRRDSMERQHLAAMLEALRQLRLAHRQCLAQTNCCNVPAELFAATTSTGGQRRAAITNGNNEIKGTPRASRDESATKRRKVTARDNSAAPNEEPQQQQQQQQHTVTVDDEAGVTTTVVTPPQTNIVYGMAKSTTTATTTATAQQQPQQIQQQQRQQQHQIVVDDLPTLRRELERPPAIVNAAAVMVASGATPLSASPCVVGQAAAVAATGPSKAATSQPLHQSPLSSSLAHSQQSPYSQQRAASSSLSSLRELLARPPILHVVVQQQQNVATAATVAGNSAPQQTPTSGADEQPLNLCVRDHNHHDRKNGSTKIEQA